MPDSERQFHLYSLFDLRHVKDLVFPSAFQGNAVIDRVASLPFKEVLSSSVASLAAFYRRHVKPLRIKEIQQDIAYLARQRCDRAYGDDGCFTRFVRASQHDAANKGGFIVNDMRSVKWSYLRFEGPVMGYESAPHNYGHGHQLDISRHRDGTLIFWYCVPASEIDAFEWEIRKLISSPFLY
jgi:hypothetical protein